MLCYLITEMQIFPQTKKRHCVIGRPIPLPCHDRAPETLCKVCHWIPVLRAVTWKRFRPLDNPQQLVFTQPVETVEEVGDIGLRVVMTCTYNLWLDVFQDADDLLGELNLTDARDTSHGSQGLIVIGHGHVGLKHQGRSQTQGFHGAKTLQFPSWGKKIKKALICWIKWNSIFCSNQEHFCYEVTVCLANEILHLNQFTSFYISDSISVALCSMTN